MELGYAIEGFNISKFAKASKLKGTKICQNTSLKYDELPYNYQLGIKRSIHCIYSKYNAINEYIVHTCELIRTDIAMFFQILKDCHLDLKYFFKFCGIPSSFYRSRYVSLENVDLYKDKILFGLVVILNRLLEYVGND